MTAEAAPRSLLNGQIADAVAAAARFAVEPASHQARALALQALAHATALAMANAAQAQGGLQQINNAAVAALIAEINAVGAPRS
jgi:Killing trait